MSRLTFSRIFHVLQRNPIFQSRGTKPQHPVHVQFACFLLRYGPFGGNTMDAALRLEIGHGTVFDCCRRVSRALRELGLRVLSWGSAQRRNEISDYIHEHFGLPNCIGIVDGSLIRLTEAPNHFGDFYYCRKKYPAVSLLPVLCCG